MTAALGLGNDAQTREVVHRLNAAVHHRDAEEMFTAGDRAVVRWEHTWDQDTLDYLGSLQMAGGAGWKRS